MVALHRRIKIQGIPLDYLVTSNLYVGIAYCRKFQNSGFIRPDRHTPPLSFLMIVAGYNRLSVHLHMTLSPSLYSTRFSGCTLLASATNYKLYGKNNRSSEHFDYSKTTDDGSPIFCDNIIDHANSLMWIYTLHD